MRTVTWNARGLLLLTAAQRTHAESLVNHRGDREVLLQAPTPGLRVTIAHGNVTLDNGEVIGTTAGLPDIGAAAETPKE